MLENIELLRQTFHHIQIALEREGKRKSFDSGFQ